MHLQLRFKHTHILLQENKNIVHGSNSKISTQNPTSQIKKKKIHSKSSTHNPTLPSSQQSITNITQHYKVITAKFYTEPKITAKSQYQVLHIDPLKHP